MAEFGRNVLRDITIYPDGLFGALPGYIFTARDLDYWFMIRWMSQ